MDSAASPSDLSGLFAFASTYAALLMTPGPSFAVVSQASISASGRETALVVFGIASGASLLIFLVLGSAANLPVYEGSALVGRYAGIFILLVIGLRAVLKALPGVTSTETPSQTTSRGGYFLLGLVTAFTNPISLAFFTGIALSSHQQSLVEAARLFPLGVFVMALGWFGFLAMLLTLPGIKRLYRRISRQLTGAMGAMLILTALSWLTTAA